MEPVRTDRHQETPVKRILLSGLLLFVFLCFAELSPGQERESPYRIRLGGVEITPGESERAILLPGRDHAVVQFYEVPGHSERTRPAEQGIRLLRYVGGNAYTAAISEAGLGKLPSATNIRATLELSAQMKLSPAFGRSKILQSAMRRNKPLRVYVRFHEDVPFGKALAALARAGLSTGQQDFYYFRTVRLQANRSAISRLLEADEVEWIDAPLPKPVTDNAQAAVRVNVDDVYKQKEFKKPTGSDVNVGIWDGGAVFNHNDLAGRLTVVESPSDISDHATHVAGIIAGSGSGNSAAKGMAPKARIYSYDFDGDVFAEMKSGADGYGIIITNNSYGIPAGWQYYEDEEEDEEYWSWLGNEDFGQYHTEVGAGDKLVRDEDLVIVFSAGNERDDAFIGEHRHYNPATDEDEGSYECLHPSDPEYRTVKIFSTGKNFIVVGATMKDDYMTSFSSWGPTAGGRLKPDVVAPGYLLLSTIPNNEYDEYAGTSMSAPVVTGTAALLIDSFYRQTKSYPGAALVKGLLIHGARDLGKEGPDYSYGFGMVDAQLSARVLTAALAAGCGSPVAEPAKKIIADDDTAAAFYEGSLDQKKKHVYAFTVPDGAKELRATLVWNDPPGDFLVNDLDLWLKPSGGKKVKPFVLNPGNPAAAAVRKRNNKDNVEHILVEDPKAGDWKVYVRGSKVPDGPQAYALVLSAGAGNDAPEQKTNAQLGNVRVFTSGETAQGSRPEEKTTFAQGDTLQMHAVFRLDANPDYGGFYSSVDIRWEIRGGQGTVLETAAVLGTVPPNNPASPGESWRVGSFEYYISSGLAAGQYTVYLTVVLPNGQTNSATSAFTVQ
jgi:subtilisin family serine protease